MRKHSGENTPSLIRGRHADELPKPHQFPTHLVQLTGQLVVSRVRIRRAHRPATPAALPVGVETADLAEVRAAVPGYLVVQQAMQ